MCRLSVAIVSWDEGKGGEKRNITPRKYNRSLINYINP